jgi:hypothetical protein
MANKITFSVGLSWSDGKDTIRGNSSLTVDQAGDNVIFQLQTIGTAAEAVELIDVTPGYIFFKNNSTTNFVEVATDIGMSPIAAKLVPGNGIMIPTETLTWFARANTAAVLLQVLAVDA